MSEANNTWRKDVSGTEYEIEFEHSKMGKYTFAVDGEPVGQGRHWGFGTKTEEFEVGPQRAKISLYPKYGGMAWGSAASRRSLRRILEKVVPALSAQDGGPRWVARRHSRHAADLSGGLMFLLVCGSDDS